MPISENVLGVKMRILISQRDNRPNISGGHERTAKAKRIKRKDSGPEARGVPLARYSALFE